MRDPLSISRHNAAANNDFAIVRQVLENSISGLLSSDASFFTAGAAMGNGAATGLRTPVYQFPDDRQPTFQVPPQPAAVSSTSHLRSSVTNAFTNNRNVPGTFIMQLNVFRNSSPELCPAISGSHSARLAYSESKRQLWFRVNRR